jgi:glycosyltransferase involved in cell wall biosynthesis
MPFFAPAFGFIARRLRRHGVGVFVVVHNAIPHERRPGDFALTRYLLSAANGFIVLSHTVETDLRSLGYQQPVRQVDHPTYDNFGPGVDRRGARERLGLPGDAPILLFFGFVRKYKGLQTLLAAMPAILQHAPSTRLLVAGEFYDDEEEYRREITRLDIEASVSVHSDYVPDADVATFFSAADVVVQPYLSATQSGVAQIAFNFDRPVITTNVGGLAETVRHGHTGLVVEPDSPPALADAVIGFIRDNMRDRMSASVAEEKSRFGWGPLLDALHELTSELPPATALGAT